MKSARALARLRFVGGRQGIGSKCAALTPCMSWVNLGVMFAVVYPVATMSRAPRSAARDRPADVVRYR
jgi:hypothetical protein